MFVQAKTEIKNLSDPLEQASDTTLKTPFVLRYGVPVLAVIAALIINRLLNVNMVGAPAMLFLCALMFSALYSGAKPALLAMPLAVVAFAYYFVTPVNALRVDVREGPRLVLFILASLFVIALSASQKRAAESLRRARDLLAGTVEELKRTNQALRKENIERERVEAELRERAAELTEAQRVGKIGNWILNLRTNRISWSEQIYRIFGVKEEDFDGTYESFVARIHPDDRAMVRETNAQTTSKGSPFDVEYRAVTPNEEIRIIREVGYAARDEAGAVCRLFGTAQDITDRKLIEWALDERLRFETLVTELSATFANLPAREVDREIDKWLQRLVEFLGVDRASFLQLADDSAMLYRSNSYTVPGLEPLPVSPVDLKNEFPWITEQLRRGITVKLSRVPDDLPEKATKDRETAAKLGVKSGLNIPVRVAGSFICAIAFTAILTYREWPEMVIPRLRLIGEIFAAAILRKRADAALRKSEEHFRQMAENIREVFWLRTADLSKLLYISPAYETVWGQSCKNLYEDPRSFFDTIHPEDRSRVSSIHERDREKGFEVEYRVMRPDGSIRWIRDRGFPIHDDAGRFYRVAGIAEDITEHKEAEALLHAREQEFRAIVENAPDHIARYDREFRRTYVNPAWVKAFNLTEEALIGKPMFSIIRDAELDVEAEVLTQIRRRYEDVFATGKSYEFDVTLPMPPGSRDYNVRIFPEFDLNGSVINVLSIARDITESKRAESELIKEKELLEKIFNNIPVMIGFVGEDGVKLVNPEWERTMGWTLKELKDQNVDIFTDAYPDLRYRQKVLDFVDAATGESVDLKIRVRDGRLIDAACAIVQLSDGTKVAIAQDITERKQAEEKLRQSERQLAEAQHLANIGSWSLDLSDNTVTWSDELYRIFGVEPSEFDHNYEAVIGTTHPEDREWLRKAIEDAIKTQLPLSVYYRITKPTGELRILHARGAVVTDEQGNSRRLHGTAQDVTERMEGEEKLRATTEQLRALSARLQSAKEEEDIRIAREIHDEMGSTLTSLRWELERLDRSIADSGDGAHRQHLRQKIAEIMRLTDVTVGTMRRIASELRPSILDDLGLTEAIEWQAQQFQTRTGIVCSCDCYLEEIEFSTDQSTAIFRIFQEALRNVMSHSGATRVEVMTRKDDGEFVLTISDNGRGITEDEKLASLSLGIVGMRERAHLIGGELEISGTRGKGTVVAVRVPISRKAKSRIQNLSG